MYWTLEEHVSSVCRAGDIGLLSGCLGNALSLNLIGGGASYPKAQVLVLSCSSALSAASVLKLKGRQCIPDAVTLTTYFLYECGIRFHSDKCGVPSCCCGVGYSPTSKTEFAEMKKVKKEIYFMALYIGRRRSPRETRECLVHSVVFIVLYPRTTTYRVGECTMVTLSLRS